MWKLFLKYKNSLMFSFVVGYIFGDCIGLFGKPYVEKLLVDNVLTYKWSEVLLIILIYSVFNMIFPLVIALEHKLEFSYIVKLKEDLRNYLFQHLLKQSNNYFSDNFSGSISSRMGDVVNNISDFINNSLAVAAIIVDFLCLVVFYSIKQPIFGLATLLWGVLYFPIFCCMSSIMQKKSIAAGDVESQCSGKILDCFTNILTIKIFSKEKVEQRNARRETICILRARKQILLWDLLVLLLAFFMGFSFSVMVIVFGVCHYRSGNGTLGDLVQIIHTLGIIHWLRWAINMAIKNIDCYAKIKRGIDSILTDYEIKDSPSAAPVQITKGEVVFSHVRFRYKDSLPLVFDDLSFVIKPNQKVGIVGYSGAGKSSLVSLLLRIQDVNDGGIYMDGHNIRDDVTQESLRNNISYIPQEPMLFHRTIRENIMYGKSNATEEEVIEACKKAYCYDFVNDLEDKFETLVGERGIKLSGGQRQRIAIARAILKNSKILILDEATSSLDSITEKIIQKALTNLMENKTVIMVAHRLSTLDNMDRIITFDKGKIVEDGTFAELLEQEGGLFKEMWNVQQKRG
jgi:ATP-binding cassette subfamily B protein